MPVLVSEPRADLDLDLDLGGEGVEVEINETQFVRRKYERESSERHVIIWGY